MSRWLAEARAALASRFPEDAPQKDQKGGEPASAPPPEGAFGGFGAFGSLEKEKGTSRPDAAETAAAHGHAEQETIDQLFPIGGGSLAGGAVLPASPTAYWLRRAMVRPPAFAVMHDATAPPAGTWCGACHGCHWWTDDRTWWCATCRPPFPGTSPDIVET